MEAWYSPLCTVTRRAMFIMSWAEITSTMGEFMNTYNPANVTCEKIWRVVNNPRILQANVPTPVGMVLARARRQQDTPARRAGLKGDLLFRTTASTPTQASITER